MNNILTKIKQLKAHYAKHHQASDSQSVIETLHSLQLTGLQHHINIDNYLYRNGIFNRPTTIHDIKRNLAKFKQFPSQQKQFKTELHAVNQSYQDWFENYGVHDGYHDLITCTLDPWKINSLLTSLICDLYVGTTNEGSTNNLMSYK